MPHWTSWNRNSQHKLQLTTCALHNWVAVWVAASNGIFENVLTARVCGGGEEVTLNLYNKFIRKYECLLFCSIYLQSSLPSKFQVAVNSISAQNRTRVYELFTTQTKEVISCSYVYKSWITLYMCMGSTRKWLWHVSLPTPRTSVLVHVVLLLKKSVSKATNASTNRQVAESEAEFIGLSCKELLFPLYSPESTLYWLNFHTKKNLEI